MGTWLSSATILTIMVVTFVDEVVGDAFEDCVASQCSDPCGQTGFIMIGDERDYKQEVMSFACTSCEAKCFKPASGEQLHIFVGGPKKEHKHKAKRQRSPRRRIRVHGNKNSQKRVVKNKNKNKNKNKRQMKKVSANQQAFKMQKSWRVRD